MHAICQRLVSFILFEDCCFFPPTDLEGELRLPLPISLNLNCWDELMAEGIFLTMQAVRLGALPQPTAHSLAGPRSLSLQ